IDPSGPSFRTRPRHAFRSREGFCRFLDPSVGERENDAGIDVGAVRPAAAGRTLKIRMKAHAADFKFPCHRIVERNIEPGAESMSERTLRSIAVGSIRSEVSDAEARHRVWRKFRKPVGGLSAKHIRDQSYTLAETVDAHVVFKAPSFSQ